MKVLVSSCILGKNCKYNGKNNYNPKVIEFLQGKTVVDLCPELSAQMSIPRPCAEIVDGVIMDIDGNNVDAVYRGAARSALEKVKDMEIDLAILQSRSPTCGVNQIYDGSFTGKLIPGRGVFAEALIKAGYVVKDSEDFQ